jgi:hypothetical protein
MEQKDTKYMPVKKFVFPAGTCGGEIRVLIPLFASADNLATMAKCIMTVAESWRGCDD